MIDREHIPAIAQSARAALQSLNEFIRVQQAGRTPLLSDELMKEFLVRRHALRQLMISAGCFDQHRVTVYPLGGPAHAALLILAAEVGVDGDSLPPQIEASAARLTEVVRALDGLQPAPTSEQLPDAAKPPAAAPTAKRPGKIIAAIALLRKHPDWTNKAIAREVGCSPPYLSQSSLYQAAREGIKRLGQEARQRSRKHRSSDMDQYADAPKGAMPVETCSVKGCDDPAGKDEQGDLLTHDGKHYCRECWLEMKGLSQDYFG